MAETKRKSPRSIREYLESFIEARDVFAWIWRELTTPESRRHLRFMLAALVGVIVFQSMLPGALGIVFDALTRKDRGSLMLGIAGFGACIGLQKFAERKLMQHREWILGLHWGTLDRRITELFLEKSAGQHIQESSTLSVSNIDKGRWKVLDLQGMLLFEGLHAVILLIVSLLFLVLLSPAAGLVMLAVVAIYVAWAMYLNYRVMDVCTPIDEEMRTLNRRRVERWEKIERVKVSAKEDQEVDEMTVEFDRIIEKDRNFWLWLIGNANLRSLVNAGGLVAIMASGAWLVWNGEWTIGYLYPLFSWTSRVSENLWQIGDIEHQINWNLPSVKSMVDALSIPPEFVPKPGAPEVSCAAPPRIEFREVSHTFPPETKKKLEEEQDDDELPAALKKVSFSIEPGEKVALLGPSGSGKSTIMRKLLRFSDPTSGEIRINGTDLRELSLESWMRCIGYIPQHPQVLDGTIRYNLTYSLPIERQREISDDELWQLMRLLEIDFGDRLTAGLETKVGKNGLKLSGGQAQRLMIGAAAIKRPKFMVIDEATSSLDSTTERKVQKGLSTLLSEDTGALIVAHRLSTVRHLCTKFVVLKPACDVKNGDGQIEAIASSFEELHRVSPTFRRLAEDQEIVI